MTSGGKYITLAILYVPKEYNLFQIFFSTIQATFNFNLRLDIDKNKNGGHYGTHLKSAKLT